MHRKKLSIERIKYAPTVTWQLYIVKNDGMILCDETTTAAHSTLSSFTTNINNQTVVEKVSDSKSTMPLVMIFAWSVLQLLN
jgi:hypothetical protein